MLFPINLCTRQLLPQWTEQRTPPHVCSTHGCWEVHNSKHVQLRITPVKMFAIIFHFIQGMLPRINWHLWSRLLTHGLACCLSDKKAPDLKGLTVLALPGPGWGEIWLFLASLAGTTVMQLNRWRILNPGTAHMESFNLVPSLLLSWQMMTKWQHPKLFPLP